MNLKPLVLATLVLLSAAPLAQAANKKPLDGTQVAGALAHPETSKADPDTLIFKDGTVRSTACDEYGFGAAPYSTAKKGNATTFDATTKNKLGNSIVWHGIVSGDKVTATALWSDQHGKTDTFAFSGLVKK